MTATKKPTAKERRELERRAANARFLSNLTDRQLSVVETDYFCEGDPILTTQIAAERERRTK